jgi:hypothetical protein
VMALEYSSNISIGGYVLAVNPSTYSKQTTKMGKFSRVISGALISQEVSGQKYKFKISSLTQSDIEEIQKRVALDYNVELIDYVPIAERGTPTRYVLESLSVETINGEQIYFYIPVYTVSILDFVPQYSGNTVEYSIEAEEQ